MIFLLIFGRVKFDIYDKAWNLAIKSFYLFRVWTQISKFQQNIVLGALKFYVVVLL